MIRSELRYRNYHIVVHHDGHLNYRFEVFRMVDIGEGKPMRKGPLAGVGQSASAFNARFRARQMARDLNKRGTEWPKER